MFTTRTLPISFALAMFVSLLTACGGGGGAGLGAGGTGASTLNPQLTGAAGMYWDLKNGIIRTDTPGGVPPVVAPIAGAYQNPSYPLLDFEYPPGWTPFTLPLQGGAGVNLVRDDGRAVWRWLGAQVPPNATPQQVRDAEIDLLRQNLGIQGGVETIALNEATVTRAPGLVQSASNVVIRTGGITAQITALVTYLDGLATAYAYVEVGAAPTAEYEATCANLFVPLYFRFLISDHTDNFLDSDGDGFRDPFDAAPFDATRH